MTDSESASSESAAGANEFGGYGLTLVIYGLHLFSAIAGISSAAFIVTSFLTGWPSILAVLLNYLFRSRVAGTYLDSHFRWQIRTFWYTLLWLVVSLLLAITVIGLIPALIIMSLVGAWVIYRVVRGLWRLVGERPMPL